MAHGWKRAGGGFQYRISGTHIYDLRMLRPRVGPLNATLSAKPLELDPVFWDIVGLTELNRKRHAFRIQGAFTVPSSTIANTQHPFDPEDPLTATVPQSRSSPRSTSAASDDC